MTTARLALPLILVAILGIQWVPLRVYASENAKVNIVTLKRCGLTFSKPSDWFVATPELIEENVRRLDHEKESIDALLASNRGAITIGSYSKDDPRTKQGVIPTINVLARPNGTRTFDAFRSSIIESSKSMASMFRNYVVKIPVSERAIAGRRAVWFSAEFDLNAGDGTTYKISSTSYAFPCGTIFIQISTSDAVPITAAQTFDDFIESFKRVQP